MADDPYAAIATMAGPTAAPKADPYADIAVSAAAPKSTLGDDIKQFGEWLGTRAIKTASGLAMLPTSIQELGNTAASNTLGMITGRKMHPAQNMMPSSSDVNSLAFKTLGIPEVNTPQKYGGKITDAAVEASLPALLSPSTAARNILPMATGGAAQEVAGEATKGTKYEPVARTLGAVLGGGGAALVQNGAGNVGQAIRNIAPNVEDTTAKIIGRGLERDSTTGNALVADHAALGPGALAVEAAGPNLRGIMRGSIAAPGPARTTAQDAFDTRIEGSNVRTTNALDKAVGPNGSLAGTVDELAALRAQQSRPAYQAAGIPARIERLPDAPVPMSVDLKLPKGQSLSDIWKSEGSLPADAPTPNFNTPNVSSPKLDALLKDSADVKAAIGAARRLPDFKDLPDNSMAMLDKAYKHLNGMEQEAIRGGNGTRAYDIGNVRKDFQKAITEANPAYGEALDTYAGPSKLIDAGTKGKEWFSKNVDPVIAGREFQAMSQPEQEAALVGVRDWARTTIGRSDRGVAAERIWNGGNNRERLKAILSAPGYEDLAGKIDIERNAIKTQRDINVGSRTTPMAMEMADNASGVPVNALADAARGRFGSAAARVIGGAVDRIGQGRTEAVNAQISKVLTSTDPKDVGLVASLAEKARQAELARGGARRNALARGTIAPLAPALTYEGRQ